MTMNQCEAGPLTFMSTEDETNEVHTRAEPILGSAEYPLLGNTRSSQACRNQVLGKNFWTTIHSPELTSMSLNQPISKLKGLFIC